MMMKTSRKSGKRAGYWMDGDPYDLICTLDSYDKQMQMGAWNPLYAAWLRNTYAYYSNALESTDTYTSLLFGGDQGELVRVMVPQARSLTRQLVTLTCKQKLAFKSIASRDTLSVIQNMRIADALSEETVYETALDTKTERMVEQGLVVGTSFMRVAYRTDRGKPVARKMMQKRDGSTDVVVFREGKLEITNPHLSDMLYDFTQDDWSQKVWARCRVKRNRWDLINQFPELEAEIMKLPSVQQNLDAYGTFGIDEDDDVYTYELYHEDTPAVNGGRLLFYASPTCVFYDDENPIGIPIEQYKPEPIEGLGFGYPMFSSLLPSQEMLDHEISSIATNHSAFGVHNVIAPKNHGLEAREFNGINLLTYNPMPGVANNGKPEVLALNAANSEAFRFAEALTGNMQSMSQITAALRGDIPASASGVAVATQTANALEFLSAYSKASSLVLERIMMHSIRVRMAFMPEELQVSSTSTLNRAVGRVYTRENLKDLRGFRMQAVNPLMQSIAGRIEIASTALKEGLITSFQDYTAVLDGQPLSTIFEADQSEADLIQTENDMLLSGEKLAYIETDPVTGEQTKTLAVLASDLHPKHCKGHKKLLNDPRVRENPELRARVEAHLFLHHRQAVEVDPLFQAMCATGMMPQLPPGGDPNAAGGGESGTEAIDPQQETSADLGGVANALDAGDDLPEVEPAKPADDLLGRR